jgi:hypothetical protein
MFDDILAALYPVGVYYLLLSQAPEIAARIDAIIGGSYV